MKLRTKALWAMGLACALAGPAYSAVIVPTAEMWIGTQKYPVPVIDLPDGSYAIDNWEGTYPEARVSISGRLKPDPNISYGIAVTDFGAPSSFSFTFTTPIVPTGFPNFVTGSLVGGLTDATGNGISIAPTLPDADGDALLELQSASVSAGGPFVNMGVDVGPALAAGPGLPGALHNYLSTLAGPQAGPGPGPWTALSTTLAFTLSGDGDIAAMTGFASIEVPEPGMATLLLAGIPLLRRRRR